jgi:hypothetical protein
VGLRLVFQYPSHQILTFTGSNIAGPEIRIVPYHLIAVFQLAGSDALHNEVPVYSIFRLGHYAAEACPSAILFSIFHLISSLSMKTAS